MPICVSLAPRWWHPSGAFVYMLRKSSPGEYQFRMFVRSLSLLEELRGRDCAVVRVARPTLLRSCCPCCCAASCTCRCSLTSALHSRLMLAILLLPSSYLSSTSLLGQRCASSSRRLVLLGPSVSRRCCSSSRRPVLPVMKALPPEVVAAYEQRFGVLGAAPAALPKGQVVPIVS